jgi:hypothetical protein
MTPSIRSMRLVSGPEAGSRSWLLIDPMALREKA